MANIFKSSVAKDVGTSAVSVYTVPGSTVTTIIGCTVGNTTVSPITCDVFLTRSAVDYYLVKGTSIPVGSAFVWAGGDQKVVAMAADIIKVKVSVATGADVVLSYLEST